jgi:hypothetical protein
MRSLPGPVSAECGVTLVPTPAGWISADQADQTLRCTFRGCPNPPVEKLQPSIAVRPWFGCAIHAPEMAKALSVGMSGATTGTAWVTTTKIRKGRR